MTPEQTREGKVKPGFKYFGTNMIFDIKTDRKFSRKTRIVVGRHKTAPPSFITYYIVMKKESFILAFLIAGMNDLYICDICNASQ